VHDRRRNAGRRSASRHVARLAATAAVGSALVAAGCGGASKPSGAPVTAGEDSSVKVVAKRGGEVTMARAVQPSTLFPEAGQSDAGTIQSQIQIFDQLTEILPGHTDVSPGLAKSWDVSGDGKTYTFHLREAKFSDGSPVTSEDVVFSIEKLIDPNTDSGFASFFDFISGVRADGPSTVVVRLKERTPAFLAYLSFNVPSIISKKYFQKVGPKAFAKRPLGSGAFQVASFKPGQALVLERNRYYWRTGQPYLDRVTINFLPDDNARVLAFRSGAADIADDIPFSQLSNLRGLPNTSLLIKQISAIDFILLNEKQKPELRDRNVRLALNYAVPREQLKRTIFAGVAPVANSMIPAIKYWDKAVPPFPYDPAKAKQLMAKSSSPDGFALGYTYVAGDSAAKAVGTILQDTWGKLGVRLTLDPVDFATLYDKLFKTDYDTMTFQPTASSSDVPIDDELVRGFLGKKQFNSFFTFYDNSALEAKIEHVVREPDENLRRKEFGEIQRMAMADPPFVPLVFTPARAIVKDKVHGFDYVKTNWFRLDQVSVTP
jgi:peptide/nickel transport system substrate-binding protein